MQIEISRFVYFSLERGCVYTLQVLEQKPVRSPFTQGGLEIKCKVTASWSKQEGLDLLKTSIDQKYNFDNRLVDDSKTVLQSLLAEHEEDNDDDNFGLQLQPPEVIELENEDLPDHTMDIDPENNQDFVILD